MSVIINPFDENGFSPATLTEKVNKMPVQYGMIRNSGIFKVKPVYTKDIVCTYVNGKITLLRTKDPKSKPNQLDRTKAIRKNFQTVHIPYQETIFSDDLAEKLKLSDNSMRTLMEEMQEVLDMMKVDHAITEEHMLVGALQGVIYDADGTTVIANLFDEFSVTKKAVNFVLGTATTEVSEKCKEVVRHVKKYIGGDTMTGVECICDSVFFDNLTSHATVKDIWKEHQQSVNKAMSGEDPTQSFSFSGITFKEYGAEASHPDTGAALPFIATGKAHFYPVGTSKTAELYYSPARNFSAIGQPGQPMYARQTMDPKEKWIDVDTEQNLFPLWNRPECLVEGDDGI